MRFVAKLKELVDARVFAEDPDISPELINCQPDPTYRVADYRVAS